MARWLLALRFPVCVFLESQPNGRKGIISKWSKNCSDCLSFYSWILCFGLHPKSGENGLSPIQVNSISSLNGFVGFVLCWFLTSSSLKQKLTSILASYHNNKPVVGFFTQSAANCKSWPYMVTIQFQCRYLKRLKLVFSFIHVTRTYSEGTICKIILFLAHVLAEPSDPIGGSLRIFAHVAKNVTRLFERLWSIMVLCKTATLPLRSYGILLPLVWHCRSLVLALHAAHIYCTQAKDDTTAFRLLIFDKYKPKENGEKSILQFYGY